MRLEKEACAGERRRRRQRRRKQSRTRICLSAFLGRNILFYIYSSSFLFSFSLDSWFFLSLPLGIFFDSHLLESCFVLLVFLWPWADRVPSCPLDILCWRVDRAAPPRPDQGKPAPLSSCREDSNRIESPRATLTVPDGTRYVKVTSRSSQHLREGHMTWPYSERANSLTGDAETNMITSSM